MEEVEYNILKWLLFEFLDLAPAIIFMTLFCKVNNRSYFFFVYHKMFSVICMYPISHAAKFLATESCPCLAE